MGYSITLNMSDGSKVRVAGYKTSNPNIWITRQSCGKFHKFALTHRPSGRAIFHNMASMETAEFAWKALEVFPIDWSPKTPSIKKYLPVLNALKTLFKEVA